MRCRRWDYKGKLSIGIWQADNEIVLSVADTGHGIPDEIVPKIFEPFFTTRQPGEGSDLGLYLIKKIVDKHEGRIGIQTKVGTGTTVTVHLLLGAA